MFYSIYCHLQVYTTISIIICRRAWSKEASMESCPFLGGLNKYPALSVSGLACDYNAQCCGTWSLECDSCRHLYHAAVTTLKGPPSSDPLVPPPPKDPQEVSFCASLQALCDPASATHGTGRQHTSCARPTEGMPSFICAAVGSCHPRRGETFPVVQLLWG